MIGMRSTSFDAISRTNIQPVVTATANRNGTAATCGTWPGLNAASRAASAAGQPMSRTSQAPQGATTMAIPPQKPACSSALRSRSGSESSADGAEHRERH